MNSMLLGLVVDLNQLGAERFDRGETIQAVVAFRQALLVFNALHLSMGLDDIVGLEQFGVFADIGLLSPRRTVVVDAISQEQIFMRPLQIDRTRFGEALLFARARRGSAVLTARATVLVNLALCVQVASEKFGHEKWSKEAVFLYQAAAAHLYVIEQDSANVVLLSMYTFHNLALLYYETLDYTECRVCLEGLWGVLCYGCIECPSLLSGRQYIEKIRHTTYFLSQPPTTAACA